MAVRGQRLRVTCAGRTVVAWVVFGSDNRRSLVIGFEAILDGCVGTMPTLTGDDGVTRNLITGKEITIEWLPT